MTTLQITTTQDAIPLKADLFIQGGGRDAEYRLQLHERDGGWVVDFAYGRRGSLLRPGCKTPKPTDYTTARKVYDKVYTEKAGEGYRPGDDESSSANSYQPAATDKEASGILPQLLHPIDSEAEALALCEDDRFLAEKKIDGIHLLVEKKGDTLRGINKLGFYRPLPAEIVKALSGFSTSFLIDGEAVGVKYVAHDLLNVGSLDLRGRTAQARWELLKGTAGKKVKGYSVIDAALDSTAKRALYEEVKRGYLKGTEEGIVFKRKNAPYEYGDRGLSYLKFPFVSKASCIVLRQNTQRSVAVGLLDEVGSLHDMGNVTIPVNYGVPTVGAIVEVRYKHILLGGKLYQPVYLGERDDVARAECRDNQLHYKEITA